MIDTEMLKASIKPGTSESLINWILFTNHHHNQHRTPEEVVVVFQRAEIGKSIDFKILERLMHRDKFIHCAIYFKDGSKRFIEIDKTGLSSEDIHKKAMDYVKQENISESSVVEVSWPLSQDQPANPPVRSCIERESKVTVTFSHAQAAELFNLLEANKNQHPDLHELVYQAMTKELFSRINTGGL